MSYYLAITEHLTVYPELNLIFYLPHRKLISASNFTCLSDTARCKYKTWGLKCKIQYALNVTFYMRQKRTVSNSYIDTQVIQSHKDYNAIQARQACNIWNS